MSASQDDSSPDRPWGPDVDLVTAVFEAVGTASMCWEHVDRAGVFDTRLAAQVAEDLLAYLRGPHHDGTAPVA